MSYPPGQWHIDYYAGGYDEPPPEEEDDDMAEWQPIKTAPKDGTRILGSAYLQRVGWSPRVIKWLDGRWITDPGFRPQYPTHWTPLPEPPK